MIRMHCALVVLLVSCGGGAVVGPQGPRGATGPAAFTEAGAMGAPGAMGFTGETGQMGSIGVAGATGDMGIAGVSGPSGANARCAANVPPTIVPLPAAPACVFVGVPFEVTINVGGDQTGDAIEYSLVGVGFSSTKIRSTAWSATFNVISKVPGTNHMLAVVSDGCQIATAPFEFSSTTPFQVTHTTGSVVVGGVTVSVTGSGATGSFSSCGSAVAPYFFNGTPAAYNFVFSSPVHVKAPYVFGASPNGQLHFERNAAAFAVESSNLEGSVGACGPGVLGVASGGDVLNTGHSGDNANNVVNIPGPTYILNVSSIGTATALLGVFFSPTACQ